MCSIKLTMYNCKECNFNSTFKHNYESHLKTKKHIKQIKRNLKDSSENMENMENAENMENMENMENTGNMENMENMENVKKIENMENMENVGNMENMENQPICENITLTIQEERDYENKNFAYYHKYLTLYNELDAYRKNNRKAICRETSRVVGFA